MIRITDDIVIDESELAEIFARASGPGGQHVNRTESAVTLRFDAARSPNLPEAVKARLRRLAGRRWTREGVIVLRCARHRSQAQNRAECRARLAALIRRAAEPPTPRLRTRPPAAARRRRLDAKARRGRLKRLRAPPAGED